MLQMIYNMHYTEIGLMSDNIIDFEGKKAEKIPLEEIIPSDFRGDDIFNDETTRVISEVWLWDTLALLDEHGIDTTNNDLNHDLTIILQLVDTLIYRYKDKKHKSFNMHVADNIQHALYRDWPDE